MIFFNFFDQQNSLGRLLGKSSESHRFLFVCLFLISKEFFKASSLCIFWWHHLAGRGFPGGLEGKESTCQRRRPRFDPCIGKIP